MTMVKKIILSVLLCTVCMFTMAQSQTVTHVVQRGETIESIAQYYNVSVEDSPEIEELYQKTTPKKATTKKETKPSKAIEKLKKKKSTRGGADLELPFHI